MNGRLYKRMQEYKASAIYFKDLVNDFPDSKWVVPALYELAFVLAKDNKKVDAIQICQDLLAKELPEKIKAKTEKLLIRYYVIGKILNHIFEFSKSILGFGLVAFRRVRHAKQAFSNHKLRYRSKGVRMVIAYNFPKLIFRLVELIKIIV